MDFSQLVKGQKLDVDCPNCEEKLTFDASLAFKSNSLITCTKCDSKIDLDTTESKKEADKIVKELKKMFG